MSDGVYMVLACCA